MRGCALAHRVAERMGVVQARSCARARSTPAERACARTFDRVGDAAGDRDPHEVDHTAVPIAIAAKVGLHPVADVEGADVLGRAGDQDALARAHRARPKDPRPSDGLGKIHGGARLTEQRASHFK
jgi:hypothetical protein